MKPATATYFPRICLLVFVCLYGLISIRSARMQKNYDPPCTTLDLRLPKYSVAAREPIQLSVDVAGAKQILGEDKARLLTYRWAISEATIVSGQGTPVILINALTPRKSSVHVISVDLEIKGVPPECANRVTRSLTVDPDCTEPTKFDEYGDISFRDERSRLDNLAECLKKNGADSVVYILAYAGRKACISEADWRANRARRYLIEKQKVPEDQVVVFDGGFRDSLTMELYISSRNACGPLPRPTLAMDEAQISGPCSDKYQEEVVP